MLPGYSNFAEKQAGGIKKALEKLQEVSPGEAAAILDRIDGDAVDSPPKWRHSGSLACKTRAVVERQLAYAAAAGFHEHAVLPT